MIRVIVGKKGSGKTKQVIEMINSAVDTEHGNVVCIEKGDAGHQPQDPSGRGQRVRHR